VVSDWIYLCFVALIAVFAGKKYHIFFFYRIHSVLVIDLHVKILPDQHGQFRTNDLDAVLDNYVIFMSNYV